MRERKPLRVARRIAASAPVVVGVVITGGWLAVSLFRHVYLALLAPALLAAGAIARAWWAGARPEVVDFGRDSAGAALDSLRRRFGITRRERAVDEQKL